MQKLKPTEKRIAAFIRNWIIEIKAAHLECTSIQDVVELGMCADLATLISEKFNSIEILDCSNPVHTWVKFNGKHFDLQNPQGVDDYVKLEYFKDSPLAVFVK